MKSPINSLSSPRVDGAGASMSGAGVTGVDGEGTLGAAISAPFPARACCMCTMLLEQSASILLASDP